MNEVKKEYLDFEVTEKNDSVEKLFCEKFSTLKTEPLTTEQSKFLISLLFVKEDDSNIIELTDQILDETHQYKSIVAIILQKRFCEQYNFCIEKRVLILLSQLLGGSPGNAVMFGTYLSYWSKKNNKKTITLDDFCCYLFPNGLPTAEELSFIWTSQKVKIPINTMSSDNLLDYYNATISLIQK